MGGPESLSRKLTIFCFSLKDNFILFSAISLLMTKEDACAELDIDADEYTSV